MAASVRALDTLAATPINANFQSIQSIQSIPER
jgi:hypothetical protein